MIDFGYKTYLKSICKGDIELLRSWRNDPRIYRWCRQSDLISDLEQERWFESQDRQPTIKMYLCYDKTTHCPVGVAGLTSIDFLNQRAEFSLYIDPQKHGQRLGSESLKTLLSHAFLNLNFLTVWGETFCDNPAQHLFKSLGMKQDGIRRQFYFKDGKFYDALLFSMLLTEFEGEMWTHLFKEPSQAHSALLA